MKDVRVNKNAENHTININKDEGNKKIEIVLEKSPREVNIDLPRVGIQGEKGKTGDTGLQGEVGQSLEFNWLDKKLGVRVEGQDEFSYVDLDGGKGDSIEFTWEGTQLGLRVEGGEEYVYVDLKGDKGDTGSQGATGDGLDFVWSGTNLGVKNELDESFSFVDIQGDKGNAIEFIWNGTQLGIRQEGDTDYTFTDLLGKQGERGKEGEKGEQGEKGETGDSFSFNWQGTKLGVKVGEYGDFHYVDLLGKQGERGKQGEQGIQGVKGDSIEYHWDNTKLGIKTEGESIYQYKDLKGATGSIDDLSEANIEQALGFVPKDYTAGQNINISSDGVVSSQQIDITKLVIESALGYSPANQADLLTPVPLGAVFTDTIVDISHLAEKEYVDTKLTEKSDISYVNTRLDDKIDELRVLTDVPYGAKFTDTIVNIEHKADIRYVNDQLGKKVDNDRVLTDVPANAKFTDTIVDVNIEHLAEKEYVNAELDKKADKIDVEEQLSSKVDSSRVLTDVPADALFTDTQVDINHLAEIEYVDNELNKKPNKADVDKELLNKVNNNQVLTNVPVGAKFTDTTYQAGKNINISDDNTISSDSEPLTKLSVEEALGHIVNKDIDVDAKLTDTITSINGKTGVISKEDIIALGIAEHDTVVDIDHKLNIEDFESKVQTNVPVDALFTDTIVDISGKADKDYVDIKLQDKPSKEYMGNMLNGKVDNERVLTDVPIDALFTDTIVDISGKADTKYVDEELDSKANKTYVDEKLLNKVDNERVLTNVPADAIFTDTIVDISGKADIDYVEEVESSKVDNERVLTDVPLNAKFTDTIVDVSDKASIDYVDTGLANKANKTYVDEELLGKVNNERVLTDVPVNAKFTDTITDVSDKADIEYVDKGLGSKVDNNRVLTDVPVDAIFTDTIVDVTDKADISYVNDKLLGKVDNSRVLTDVPINAKFTDTIVNVTDKADIDYVDSQLATKVNKNQVLTDVPENAVFTDTVVDISSKAEQDYVDTKLKDKADTSYVERQLDNKVDSDKVLTDVPIGALFTDTNTEYIAGNNITIDENNSIHAKGEELTKQSVEGALGYTVDSNIPTDAKFTDTIYNDEDNVFISELVGDVEEVNIRDADTISGYKVWVGEESDKGVDINTIYFCYEEPVVANIIVEYVNVTSGESIRDSQTYYNKEGNVIIKADDMNGWTLISSIKQYINIDNEDDYHISFLYLPQDISGNTYSVSGDITVVENSTYKYKLYSNEDLLTNNLDWTVRTVDGGEVISTIDENGLLNTDGESNEILVVHCEDKYNPEIRAELQIKLELNSFIKGSNRIRVLGTERYEHYEDGTLLTGRQWNVKRTNGENATSVFSDGNKLLAGEEAEDIIITSKQPWSYGEEASMEIEVYYVEGAERIDFRIEESEVNAGSTTQLNSNLYIDGAIDNSRVQSVIWSIDGDKGDVTEGGVLTTPEEDTYVYVTATCTYTDFKGEIDEVSKTNSIYIRGGSDGGGGWGDW